MVPEKNSEGRVVWKCRKCGVSEETKSRKLIVKEEINEIADVPIVDMEANQDKMSTIEIKCNKCKNNKAMWWMQQTRSGDEPATRFFKCVKCGHTWREYA